MDITAGASSTIFVRNLSFDVDDKQLGTYFDCGPVKRAFTLKDKNTDASRGVGMFFPFYSPSPPRLSFLASSPNFPITRIEFNHDLFLRQYNSGAVKRIAGMARIGLRDPNPFGPLSFPPRPVTRSNPVQTNIIPLRLSPTWCPW